MRVHDVTMFRAAGVLLDWPTIARRWLEIQHAPDIERILSSVKDRHDVRLAWGCSRALGVPKSAFTVWTRKPGQRATTKTRISTFDLPDGEVVTWGFVEAADVRVAITVADPGQPVGL